MRLPLCLICFLPGPTQKFDSILSLLLSMLNSILYSDYPWCIHLSLSSITGKSIFCTHRHRPSGYCFAYYPLSVGRPGSDFFLDFSRESRLIFLFSSFAGDNGGKHGWKSGPSCLTSTTWIYGLEDLQSTYSCLGSLDEICCNKPKLLI